MEHAREHACRRPKAKAHVNVTDLCHGGIGDHPTDAVRADRVHRSDDHAEDAKHKEHMDDLALLHNTKAHHTVKNLQQQKVVEDFFVIFLHNEKISV